MKSSVPRDPILGWHGLRLLLLLQDEVFEVEFLVVTACRQQRAPKLHQRIDSVLI